MIVISYSIYYGVSRWSALSGKVRYTIATTIELQWSKSGRNVKYKYIVNGKEYFGITTYAYESQVPDGRYFIKYSVKSPEYNELYQEHPVPDKIIEAPKNGWEFKPWQ